MKQEHPMTPGVLVPCDVTEMCPGDLRLRVRCLEDEVVRLRGAPDKEWAVCLLGMRGGAYDTPETKRAYTYAEQPNNLDAHRLGMACHDAATATAGDAIDRGLALLKALQEAGFGVFSIGAEYASPQSPPSSDSGGVNWKAVANEQMEIIHKLKAQPAPDVAALVEAARDKAFMSGICVALQHVTGAGQGVLFKEIVLSVGFQDCLHFASEVEPDEWELAGFAELSSIELGFYSREDQPHD